MRSYHDVFTIWYPDSGEADALLIRDNDYPKDKNFKFIQTVSAGTDHIIFTEYFSAYLFESISYREWDQKFHLYYILMD